MKLTKDDIHPTLWKETDELSSRWTWGSQVGGMDREERKIYARHIGIWSKRYGAKLLIGIFAWLAAMVGGAVAMRAIFDTKSASAFWVLAMFVVGFIACIVAYKQNLRTVHVDELENLMPVLDLNPIQRAYAQAVVLAADNDALSEDERSETLRHLKTLMDEEERLSSYRRALAAADGEASDEAMHDERSRIQELLASTSDPIATGALQRSLEILEHRAEYRSLIQPSRERVDAQLELIRQTLCGVRDSLARLKASPQGLQVDSLDVGGLRANVEQIYQQTRAIETAVAEVRAI